MKRFLFGLGILLVGLLLWGFFEPRFLLDTQSTEAEVPNLPAEWEGRQIALLADFQIGMWMDNRRMVGRAIRQAVEAQPALILVAGDFVYKPDSTVVDAAVELMQPALDADIPVVAVLGNHDYSLMKAHDEVREELADYLAERLEAGGAAVLENETIEIDGLHIVGVGSDWAGRSNGARALASLSDDEPRIVLMHNPVAFRDLPAHAAPVTLSAHTHGGQIRIPFTPSSSWLDIARSREVIADGWAADSIGATGNRAYVSRGLGFSLVPIRIMCRPELTLVTLRRAAAAQ